MIQVMLRFSIYFYHLPTKLWEDNVFSCVYLSVSLSIPKWSPHLTIIHVSHRSHETLGLSPGSQTCSNLFNLYLTIPLGHEGLAGKWTVGIRWKCLLTFFMIKAVCNFHFYCLFSLTLAKLISLLI